MLYINATSFRENLFDLLEQTIQFNEPVHISTKAGNAVLISEKDYNSLTETLQLSLIPETKRTILDGLHTPLSDCLSEDTVTW